MEFEIQEIRDLAEFFAKRFPGVAERERIVASAGLSAENLGGDSLQAWERIVRSAMEKNRLWNLAEAGRIALPADANLRDLANAFAETKQGGLKPKHLVAAVALFALAGFGFALTQPNPVSDTEPATELVAVTDDIETPEPVVDEALELASVEEAAAEPIAPETAEPPSAPPAVVAPVAKAPVAPEKPRVAPAAVAAAKPQAESSKRRRIPADGIRGRCGGAKEEIVGYWYAGDATPGEAGQVIDIGRAVNDRVDYPRFKNGYSSRTDIVCWLQSGDKVRLTQAPIYVEGDVYWVPLVAGDLIAVPSSDA